MEPGSQLTSALNKIRIQVGKKIEAHVRTHTEKEKKEKVEGKTLHHITSDPIPVRSDPIRSYQIALHCTKYCKSQRAARKTSGCGWHLHSNFEWNARTTLSCSKLNFARWCALKRSWTCQFEQSYPFRSLPCTSVADSKSIILLSPAKKFVVKLKIVSVSRSV